MFCWNTTIGTLGLSVHWLNHTFTAQQSYQLTPITGIVTEWEHRRGEGGTKHCVSRTKWTTQSCTVVESGRQKSGSSVKYSLTSLGTMSDAVNRTVTKALPSIMEWVTRPPSSERVGDLSERYSQQHHHQRRRPRHLNNGPSVKAKYLVNTVTKTFCFHTGRQKPATML